MMKNILFLIISTSILLIGCPDSPMPPLPPPPPIKCEPEHTLIQRSSCEDYPLSQNASGYINVFPDSLSYLPAYSPLNPNEILFAMQAKRPFGPSSFIFIVELWKMNICTGDKMYLTDELSSVPSVNQNGWIILSKRDLQLWAIKTNGDSLRQLTFDGKNTQVRWLPNQQSFSFLKNGSNGTEHLIMNFTTGVIDTLDLPEGSISNIVWSKTQDSAVYEVLDGNTARLKLIDLKTNKIDLLNEVGYNETGGFSNITWPAHSDKIYWTQGVDFFEFDLNNRVPKMVFEGCNGDRLSYVSISHDDQQLLAGWLRRTVIRLDDSLLHEFSIVRMDLGNVEEMEVLEMGW